MEVFPYIRTTISLCFADMGEMTFHLHFANGFSFSLQSSSLTFHILSFLFPFTLAKTQQVADTESSFHDICVVLDSSEGHAQKKSIRDCIKALEGSKIEGRCQGVRGD